MHRQAYIVTILTILIVNLIRSQFSSKKKSYGYWLTNFYVQLLAFGFALDISSRTESPGAWGGVLVLSLNHILGGAALAWLAISKRPFTRISKLEIKYAFALLCIATLSYFNPSNQYPFGTIIAFLFFLGPLILWIGIRRITSPPEIFKAVFDGLAFSIGIQLILSIGYPILGITSLTSLYRDATEWATRLGTRAPSAVGTFPHPGNLALFVTMSSIFFFSCALANLNRKISFALVAASFFIIVLTQSRTSILVAIATHTLAYTINEILVQKKSPATLFLYSAGAIIIFGVILISPLGDIFLKSDVGDMTNARMIHYLMGFEMFRQHFLTGVGLNSHIAYELKYFSEIQRFVPSEIEKFYTTNPIHNIHIIILCETGLIGVAMWLGMILSGTRSAIRGLLISVNRSKESTVLHCTFLAALSGYLIYGMTGWAPTTNEEVGLICVFMFASAAYINHLQPIKPGELGPNQ